MAGDPQCVGPGTACLGRETSPHAVAVPATESVRHWELRAKCDASDDVRDGSGRPSVVLHVPAAPYVPEQRPGGEPVSGQLDAEACCGAGGAQSWVGCPGNWHLVWQVLGLGAEDPNNKAVRLCANVFDADTDQFAPPCPECKQRLVS
jgi:hypothetical protein